MKKRNILNIAIIIALFAIGVYRYRNQTFTDSKTRILMGTFVEITLTSKQNDVSDIVDQTFDLMEKYDKKFSYYNREGELGLMNYGNENEFVIDDEYHEILSIAKKYHQLTDGMYDVTIGVLSDLWGGGRTYPPPADSIAAALELTGFSKLSLSKTTLSKPQGMRLNLGSIAKGYIVDKCIEYAIESGAEAGIINAGGDIRVFGEHKKPLKIGVQHPRSPSEMIEVLELDTGSVVTSGDYERYFEYEGKKYHHIISPKDGYPVDYIISATILAPDATLADVISTSVFLLPPEKGIELIKSVNNVDGILFYYIDDEIVSLRTEGIKKYIRNGE
ncbi:MAG: FAD:protein FMN transferase [Candidatus Cloacimonas sp.]|nr:FAD:protein FMN transferase [Candidatus Cloacimonadota bacterium]